MDDKYPVANHPGQPSRRDERPAHGAAPLISDAAGGGRIQRNGQPVSQLRASEQSMRLKSQPFQTAGFRRSGITSDAILRLTPERPLQLSSARAKPHTGIQ